MTDTQLIKPSFPNTEIGNKVQQAWNDQEALGWMNVAKGRICIKWGIAQELFYKMHPDLQKKKIMYSL